MKLLIITQVVDKDDPVLGFFHRWIEEFANKCESVTVICLKRGRYDLPSNVRVCSLGKDEGKGRCTYVVRFFHLIYTLRKSYDAVFVHMNPEYILLGGLLWRAMGKHIGLWYVHKSVTRKLKIAVALVDDVFTASKESFRIATKKLHIVGHGIDTTFFSPASKEKRGGKTLHILSAGRLSFTKHHDLIMRACALLPETTDLTIAGAPVTSADRGYENKLHALAQELRMESRVRFTGPLTQEGMKEQYARADVFVHASTTGSYDKVVLEALASGVPVVTSSEAFRDGVLPVTSVPPSIEGFVEGVKTVEKENIHPDMLARVVQEKHSLGSCVRNILAAYT